MEALLAVGFLMGLGAFGQAHAAGESTASDIGESIYRRGVLASGAPLVGSRRAGSPDLTGAGAACVNCHRRSGLGGREGTMTIPPLTSEYLFRDRGTAAHETMLHGYGNQLSHRDAYTDASLAHAIRDGVDSMGRTLSPLMPRFALDDAGMEALIGYLKKLGTRRMPGVTASVLHLATVVTPDADPLKRQGTLEVLKRYFIEKNAVPFGHAEPPSAAGRAHTASIPPGLRHWQLHVWELSGPESGWREQLDRDLAREPVMALLSGVGGSKWGPVHEFCEKAELPCLFPNLDVPTVAEGDFYSLYYSNGVLLEAQLIARQVAAAPKAGVNRKLLQIYRAGDSGEAAAKALTAALQGKQLEVRSKALPAGRAESGLRNALRAAASADLLVLWLRPEDIAQLGTAPQNLPVYLSGLMGGLEQAPLPASWRAQTKMTYPVDLPERRVVRVDYGLGWFTFRHIPVVAMQAQSDTYLACGILTETLEHASDISDPTYLVELLQETLDHRVLTGYYPRLTLAAGQTLASKGSYLVRFAEPSGPRLVVEGEWTVP